MDKKVLQASAERDGTGSAIWYPKLSHVHLSLRWVVYFQNNHSLTVGLPLLCYGVGCAVVIDMTYSALSDLGRSYTPFLPSVKCHVVKALWCSLNLKLCCCCCSCCCCCCCGHTAFYLGCRRLSITSVLFYLSIYLTFHFTAHPNHQDSIAQRIKSRTVLELGAGCGLPSIAVILEAQAPFFNELFVSIA